MPDVRTSFVLDELVLSQLDDVCQAEGVSRSEYLRRLIYAALNEQPPEETLKLVRVRSTDWVDYKASDWDQPGAPRYIVYRSDGTFHTSTAGSVSGLFRTVEEFQEVRERRESPRAVEQFWRSHACQPVFVGPGTRIGGGWGNAEPEIQPAQDDAYIQYVQPYTRTPENRLSIQVAALDPDDEQNVADFHEMISVLKRSADIRRESQTPTTR